VSDEYVLRIPIAANEWQAYHAIRRAVLFEARGLVGVYDENHPDEHLDGHYPLVLFHGHEALGVLRVDVAGHEAIFRRVAIRPDRQRAGHGRTMLALAERFACAKGCVIIRSFVDRTAVQFYLRCGFVCANASDGTGSVPMWKRVDRGRLANKMQQSRHG